MNKKKTLGVLIPYYCNNEICEREAKILVRLLKEQLSDDMLLCIYEDGQYSEWLHEEFKNFNNVKIMGSEINKGVSYAKNQILDYLIDKVKYILFLDMDDYIDDDYLPMVWEYCADNTHDIIETLFSIRNQLITFEREKIRSTPVGSAIKVEVIGKNRFKENVQIGEDTDFMNTIVDLTKHRKKLCKTIYYYQLGINPDSLTIKYERREIDKERGKENDKRNSKVKQ